MKKIRTACVFILSVLIAGAAVRSSDAATIKETGVPAITGDAKVDHLLSQMTLDEKISLLHGASETPATYQGQAGYLAGVPRLGISPMRFSDGPPGVLTRVPAMAPTATMGLAATFSTEDARQNGLVIAREARSHGINVVLEPFINIDRDISFRRSYNTFGEDPLLTGEIGAAEIQGIQSLGIMSQAKHYIAFDSTFSTDHSTYDVDVEPQALHEIYAVPFEMAIHAGVSSIMCSYNKVDGRYSCGNPDTLISVLRDTLGFKGFVTSDWGAVHATDFINDGLDMEMPGPVHLNKSRPTYFLSLKEAVEAGTVSEAMITRAAGSILYEMDRFGLLDGRPEGSISSPDVQANAKVVEKTAEDAAVLLKNDGHILPLSPASLHSLVLIGPGAGQTIAVGQPGEKAVGLPQREIGTFQVLKKYEANSPEAGISYAVADDRTGTAIAAKYLSHDGAPGLERIDGASGKTITDSQIDFTASNGRALLIASSYRWSGTLTIPTSGSYSLHMQILGAYGTLTLDGKKIAGNGKMYVHGDITQAGQNDVLPTTDGLDNVTTVRELTAGPHKLSLTITPDSSNQPMQVRLSWLTPEQQQANYAAAIEAARKAKTAIVFAWAQGDPHFHLAGDQDKLIEDVSAVNPNTIVVLNVSQPVDLPWLTKVKAVLQMWWPGDEGGWATANVLLGRVSPAGRLPFTWGYRLTDYPATDPAHPERMGTNASGKGIFSEGIYVGYRWFDKQGIEPLFPFGFGLSYTNFDYSHLVANHNSDGLNITFRLHNAGSRASDEVAQVYLGKPENPPEGAQFADRSLVGFRRVHLKPNESRTVSVRVPLRAFQYWSTGQNRWVTAPGERVLYVGRSSRDLPLHVTSSTP